MAIELQVKYSTEDAAWLCFRHAVKRAMAGEDVQVEVDDYYDNEYYVGTISCVDCEAVMSTEEELVIIEPRNGQPYLTFVSKLSLDRVPS